MLIEKIKINKLFNYANFEYAFSEKDTIFVGENGAGKTTILSIIYHVLCVNINELLKYEFETIVIKYEGFDKEVIIDHKELEEYSRFYNRLSKYNRLGTNTTIKKLNNYIKDFKFDNSDEDIKLAIDIIKKENIAIPYRIAIEVLSGLRNYESTNYYINTTSNALKEYRILYFPTYRRIEEDLTDINIYDVDSDEDDYEELVVRRNRIRHSNNIGELIQFGMNDVKKTINSLLDTIKRHSIDSFNKMTGDLLSQYASGNLKEYNDTSRLTENEITIALSRAGVDDDLKNNILEQFRKDKFKTNHYLLNLILNLVEKNKTLEPIDKKIKDFEEICNKYLYNKKFAYDPSAVTLLVINPEQNREIEISKLSSGEKQIISTFSKIYLENNPKLIVLFDEPELSLSLEWQKNFIYDISKSDNCKFSISVTHSPYIFERLFDNTTEINKYINK